MEISRIPEWIKSLAEEDYQFLKRFVMVSGSLKALALDYGVSYPTIRIRLDRLIAKIEAAEDQTIPDDFHRQMRIMLADGMISPQCAKQLIQAHRDVVAALDKTKKTGETEK